MKTKRIFALVSAFTIALAGVPAHAVFAEEAPSVDEAVVVEETVEETAKEVVTDEVVTPVVEKTVETEEETAADDKTLTEDETKTTEDAVVEDEEATESNELTEDEEADLNDKNDDELDKDAEEEHEHELIYTPAGNHQHKVTCAKAEDNCDFEEVIEDCVDEDDDKICDLCGASIEKTNSSINVKVLAREYSYYDVDGNLVVSDNYSTFFERSLFFNEEVLTSECINMITSKTEVPEKAGEMSEDEYMMTVSIIEDENNTKDIILSSIKTLDLPEECPENLEITITLDDLCENVSNVESNYVDDNAAKEKLSDEEETDLLDEEDAESEDDDTKDEDETLADDTEIAAKEDEILPEDVVVDETETVEPTEQTEELVEDIVVDEVPVDEAPTAEETTAEEAVTDSVVDGE